ncbi:bifunctional 4-hydroxy-2-oxoglutarate aldolase/2-dehydro-3-deoxy-phosphogluconate aldolase [Actinoallomurus sp. NBC_01490]|uniref:bifunctional 4-hydroxy-2-oxoglutarate aldolase/2-dehydro-3-deoxy-phosphogluconate aldolase n=1 Tax=Actinoallomurus sp. NBC_01490 TaxID=2903557 RepID=UPI002E2EC106|nr:bifunctional 4-hydroxy-2-oxoglutarate aldolase/2-dehydro-3-deoxy-phosphogluconate aldolase [Actinoallomurus sp. NBC_01490]
MDTSRPTALAETEDRIRAGRIVAVLRLRDHRHAVEVAETLAEAGVTALEFTLDHPDSLAAVERVAARMPGTVAVGAGTVLSPTQVTAARDAGARFVVCPHTDPLIITTAIGCRLAPLPGVTTPTELFAAQQAGARLLKLFPAGPLGIGYLKALRGPFEHAELVPTGGVEIDTIGDWLAAGATAVGVGSSLVDRTGALDGLADRARRAVAAAHGGAS